MVLIVMMTNLCLNIVLISSFANDISIITTIIIIVLYIIIIIIIIIIMAYHQHSISTQHQPKQDD